MSVRFKFYQSKKHGILLIAPKKKHISKLFKALDFLKRKDQKGFKKVVRNLKVIFIAPYKGFLNNLFFKERIWISCYSFLEASDYPHQYIASLLLHEAEHIEQGRKGRKFTGYFAEKEAYLVQRKFLQQIKYNNAVVWLDRQFKRKWWKKLDKNTLALRKFQKLLDDLKKRRIHIMREK